MMLPDAEGHELARRLAEALASRSADELVEQFPLIRDPARRGPKGIDWYALRLEVGRGVVLEDVAERHGVPLRAIASLARRQDWGLLRAPDLVRLSAEIMAAEAHRLRERGVVPDVEALLALAPLDILEGDAGGWRPHHPARLKRSEDMHGADDDPAFPDRTYRNLARAELGRILDRTERKSAGGAADGVARTAGSADGDRSYGARHAGGDVATARAPRADGA